jgi:hypothetical protein
VWKLRIRKREVNEIKYQEQYRAFMKESDEEKGTMPQMYPYIQCCEAKKGIGQEKWNRNKNWIRKLIYMLHTCIGRTQGRINKKDRKQIESKDLKHRTVCK